MRAALIGKALLGLGLAIGVVAGLGMVFGFRPSTLPAALLDIAAYKLTFLAALGLLAAGAILRRYGARADQRSVSVPRWPEVSEGPVDLSRPSPAKREAVKSDAGQ